MTNEISTDAADTSAPESTPAPVQPSAPATPAAMPAHAGHAAGSSCCSETHAAPLPVAGSLPVASDCCSSASTECATGTPADAAESEVDDATLIEALREVIDPELMINIVDLGLVYSINHTDRKVNVEMTLTSPACPAGPQIIMQSKLALEKVNGVDVAEIKLTMSPPWTPDRMTDEARDQLGIF
jgi:metal-sulfur cluster biosynthetic enzyme